MSIAVIPAFLIVTSCKKEAAVLPLTPVTTTADTVTVPENKVDRNALLQLVNGLRSRGCKCGGESMPAVSPLTWNGQLERAAYDHSKDMSLLQYFDHNGRNGSTPGSRLDVAGYKWMVYGENIATGNMDEQAVVLGWLTSPLHCKNMMDARFNELGAGRHDKMWTLELGSRSSGK
ncbi:CAP domain-containing protein [Chitinophaga nivalis]|uniref:CAP domain-containing protein n=1 Tax=Chitinophaga nivalis TaxID=2991709 RepID=A0ABT3IVD0_9BACT|nr:CAP domain-containing protein [Chitinophaga nivalis]MCW3462370.1 CAP domain-containing protein [Chitinophaga nivalis]MCW3487939.1 CAP domain-containing protein [Chitinophaga nivalis]